MLACQVRVGAADWREVERVGLRQIADGNSAPALVALASVTASTEDVQSLVDAAVLATGEQLPTDEEAALSVAAEVAEQVRQGLVPPVEGARSIWALARQVPGVEPQLRPFIGLASEWEDDEHDRASYDADIVEAANQLISWLG